MTELGLARAAPGLRAEHGQRRTDHPPAGRTGGAAPRDLVHARATGLGRGVRRSAGLPGALRPDVVRVRATPALADRRSTARIRRPDASPRSTWSPNYLPSTATLSERVAELTRRLLPTGQCSVEAIADQLAMHPRTLQRRLADRGRAMPGPHRAGAPRPGGEIPRRTGVASQPDRRPARVRRAEHPQPLVPSLVREDASAVPSRAAGNAVASAPVSRSLFRLGQTNAPSPVSERPTIKVFISRVPS